MATSKLTRAQPVCFLRTFSLDEYFSLVGDNTLPRMLFELANMMSLTSFTLDGDLSLLHWSWSWLSVFRLKCSLFFNESIQMSSFLLSNGFDLREWIAISNLAPDKCFCPRNVPRTGSLTYYITLRMYLPSVTLRFIVFLIDLFLLP